MPSLTFPIASAQVSEAESPMLFPGIVGFYFVARISLIFLFFQSNPVMGTAVSITAGVALLYGAVLYSAQDQTLVLATHLQTPLIRWIFALLALSLISVLWTGSPSMVAALAYWASMFADVAIVLVLLRSGDAERYTEGIMKGAIWGAVALALIAWCTPATADFRLGNDEFLHPNEIAPEFAIAALFAQYLAQRGTRWKWLGISLAITLLRTLSKTTIIAFILAECWYLIQSSRMARKAKMQLGAAALVAVASFWGVMNSYIDVYSSAGGGNQAETLTGRTVLWTVALSMGLEKPWLGHGILSFKAMIPALGTFQAVHAHNELVQLFFEYGVTGVAVVAGVYWSLYRQARCAPLSELRTLALTLLLFTLVLGLADALRAGPLYPLWLLTAFSICLVRGGALEEKTS